MELNLFSDDPEHILQDINLISEVITKESSIKIIEATIRLGSELHLCVVRKVVYNSIVILDSILTELKMIQTFLNFTTISQHMCELLGYFHDKLNKKMILVFKRYDTDLRDMIKKNTRFDIIRQLIEVLSEIHKNGMFHGSLCPENIRIDITNNSIKLYNLFNANEITTSRWFDFYKANFEFLNLDFVSPEVLLMIKCESKNIETEMFDPIKSDIFSFGLIILFIEGIGISGLNNIEIDLSYCRNKFINKSRENLHINFEYDEYAAISKSIIKSEDYINKTRHFIEDKSIFNITYFCLKIYSSKRKLSGNLSLFEENSDLTNNFESDDAKSRGAKNLIPLGEEITNIFSSSDFKRQPITPNESTNIKKLALSETNLDLTNNLESDAKSISAKNLMLLAQKITKIFSQSAFESQSIIPHELKAMKGPSITSDESIHIINQINSILKEFKDQFSEAQNYYLDSDYGSPFDLNSALYEVFKNFLERLQNPKYLNTFCGYCQDSELRKLFEFDFVKLVTKIQECESFLQNYLTTGLFVCETTDLLYFFNKKSFFYRTLIKFEAEELLVIEFESILSSSIVQDVFIRAQERAPDMNEFRHKILKKIFLVETQYSLFGLTTYDQHIYIKHFGYPQEVEPTENIRAAIYIVLLHELGHCIPRINCKTRRESKCMTTPKFCETQTKEKAFAIKFKESEVNQVIENNKGEAGTRIETLLFGKKLDSVNIESGKTLININSYSNIKQFRKDFNQRNERDIHSIPLRKDDIFRFPVKCGRKLLR